MSLPSPLNARLDALVSRANAAGENTSRKELLAALILGAPEAGDDLGVAVRRYRTAKSGDAVVDGEDASAFLDERAVRPGPRPRRDPR